MQVISLLITKDDHEVIDEWCRNQLRFYNKVICLDGSESEETAKIVDGYQEQLIYLHEQDFVIPQKTDHGLRRIVHDEIVRRFGKNNWVMCCHADEFCYHDPRKIAMKAESEGYDFVSWFSLHFFPHPNELQDWQTRRHLPVTQRHLYYHWSHHGNGLPWIEGRLYRNSPNVFWDDHTHGSVRPHGLLRPAPFCPILRHYKVTTTNLDKYDVGSTSSHYRDHWLDAPNRTGLSFPVNRFEDLFISSERNYSRCDRFDGTFNHPWNMGEQYRPE